MIKEVTCEIFIAMHEDGGWVVGNDESDALNKLAEDEGSYHARVVKLTVKMNQPKMTETEVEVPDEAANESRLGPST